MRNTQKVKSKHQSSNAIYALLPTFKIAKRKYEAAKGNYWQNYIGEVGEWVEVTWWKYVRLKFWGYKVRKT